MEPGGRRSRQTTLKPALLCSLLLVAIALVQLAPVFVHFDRLGGKDWNAFLGQEQAETTTLLDYGQFPGWNPWRRGGQVGFAQPESMFLSPVTPLALLVGPNAAFKLLLLPLFVAAGLGLFVLAGDLGLRGGARLVPSVAFLSASVLPLYVNGGLPNWLFGMAILPWLLVASRRADRSRKWLAGGGLLYAALLYCGNVHHFVFFPIVLAIEAVARAGVNRSWRPLLATAALGAIGVALSLFRLIPLLELFAEFPRTLDASGRFMPLSLVARSLFLPHPDGFDDIQRVVLTGGSALYWVDCGAYVGFVVGALALLGVIARFGRSWPVLLIGGAFLWLALGSSVAPSLWNGLRHLPVYASMQAPERFMGFVTFALALLAGFGAEAVAGFAKRRFDRNEPAGAEKSGVVASVVAGVLLVAIAAPLLIVNTSITRGAFPVEPPVVRGSTLFHPQSGASTSGSAIGSAAVRPPFHQGKFPGIKEQWGGPLYESVVTNVGNVDGQSDVPSRQVAQPSGQLLYRGEAWLAAGHGTIESLALTPNCVKLKATVESADTLVLNQTFFPGWQRADSGEPCSAADGLLALPLAPGQHDVELRYAPATIPTGLVLSFLAAAALAFWWWRMRGTACSAPFALPIDRGVVAVHVLLAVGAIGWHATRKPSGANAPPKSWRERATTVDLASGPDALQRAIDAAGVGEVVCVPSGGYPAITIRRGIVLVADWVGSAWVAGLTIADIPAAESVTVIGVQIGRSDAPRGDSRVLAPLRVERCAGNVVITAAGWPPSDIRDRVALSYGPLDLVVESSAQLLLMNGVDSVLDIGRAACHASRVALCRCRIARQEDGRPAFAADGSVLLFNACGSPPNVPNSLDTHEVALSLKYGSVARLSATRLERSDIDPTSLVVDLDAISAEPFGLALSPQEKPQVNQIGGGQLTIHGPARARGTLLVSRRPCLIPLKGKFAGQFLQVDLAASPSQYPFELDAAGQQEIGLPSFTDSFTPGDGLYFQAYLDDGGDPTKRLYSLMDGGPIIPKSPKSE